VNQRALGKASADFAVPLEHGTEFKARVRPLGDDGAVVDAHGDVDVVPCEHDGSIVTPLKLEPGHVFIGGVIDLLPGIQGCEVSEQASCLCAECFAVLLARCVGDFQCRAGFGHVGWPRCSVPKSTTTCLQALSA